MFTGGLMDVLGALRDMETVTLAQRTADGLDDAWLISAGLDKSRRELRCYAAGPRSEPQAVPLSRDQQATLESLGWTPPDEAGEDGEKHSYWCTHRYQLEAPRERERAAQMLVETLQRVHDFREPTDVKLEGSFAGPAVQAAIASLEELLRLAHSRSA